MTPSPAPPSGVPTVTEVPRGPLGALVHPRWLEEDWLVQGTTTRAGERDLDLGLFSGGSAPPAVRRNWRAVAEVTGFSSVIHARQVHGAEVHVLRRDVAAAAVDAKGSRGRPAGGPDEVKTPDDAPVPRLLDPADGHLTDRADVLLAVTAADCVPVFLVDADARAVGAVHAGWRGVAAGILEQAIAEMGRAFGGARERLLLHFGPAICGTCYEVGPEVFDALGQPVPTRPAPIDVRAVLARRAVAAGVPTHRITLSSHCTRCTGSDLYSHRAGDAQRQVGFIGVRSTHRGAARGVGGGGGAGGEAPGR